MSFFTVGSVLCNTDNNEFLSCNYQLMFVQNAVTTCAHFGYSLCVCVCVLWASLVEDSFDGRIILRTDSSKYR